MIKEKCNNIIFEESIHVCSRRKENQSMARVFAEFDQKE